MTLTRWLGLFTIVTSVYVLWQIRAIVFLLLAAVVIATALNRLVRQFRRSHVRRGYAILLAITITLIFIISLVALVVIRLIEEFDQLLSLIPISIDQVQVLSAELQARISEAPMRDFPALTSFTQQLQATANWFISNIYIFFSNSLVLALNLLFILVLTIMLLANPQPYRHGLIQIFPNFYRQRADEIFSKCEVKLVHYIGGILLSMVFVSISSTIGLLILQVPLPIVNGLIAGLCAFIPYIGVLIGAISPILVALLDEPWKAAAVFVVYFAIQQIEENFVAHLIMKRQTNLLPVVTLVSLVSFGIFFGPLGFLLGVPILVVVQTWVEEAVIHDILDHWKSS